MLSMGLLYSYAMNPSSKVLTGWKHRHLCSDPQTPTWCLQHAWPQHSQNPTRTNRSLGLIRNSYLLNKQMIIDNSCLGLANTRWKVHTFFGYQDQREWLLTFGLGIIILRGVSRRKFLAGLNILTVNPQRICYGLFSLDSSITVFCLIYILLSATRQFTCTKKSHQGLDTMCINSPGKNKLHLSRCKSVHSLQHLGKSYEPLNTANLKGKCIIIYYWFVPVGGMNRAHWW
jgi:hypothetical protein